MNNYQKHFYEFGPFRLDAGERLLFRANELVPLAPKVLDILFLLVQHSGHILEKDELMKAVWPDTFVEEYSLTRNISILRKALGEGDTEQQFIETIPKRGYRFVAEVQEFRDEALAVTPSASAVTSPSDSVESVGPAQATTVNELTQERETTPAEPIAPGQPTLAALTSWLSSTRSKVAVVGLLLLIAISFALSQLPFPSQSNAADAEVAQKSIAVLPFKLLGTDSPDEYLSLAMADALITNLSNIRQVVVRPTSAVLKYNNPAQDPVAAGQELKVEHVLEGSIRRAGARVRVTVQLIGVREGVPLWAEKFDEDFTDVFAVEDSISEKVATALTLRLTGEERRWLTRRHTENSDAYRAYLMGRYFWNKRTPDSLKRGIDYFNQAIAKDANYALAYAGLADCYSLLTAYSVEPPSESFPKAEAAALKALELDRNLAEAHTSLAYVKEYYGDWAAAEAGYRRALELNPNYPIARHWYSFYLAKLGRFEEAIGEAQRAQELDPLSQIVNTGVGRVYYWARQPERAVEQCRKALELDPNFAVAHRFLGLALIQQGKYPEAIAALERAQKLSDTDPHALALLGYAYAVAKRTTEAQKILAELQQMAQKSFVSPYSSAVIYAGLGEKERSLEWLQKAYDSRSAWLSFMKVDPTLDPVRREARFQDLLRRLGLVA